MLRRGALSIAALAARVGTTRAVSPAFISAVTPPPRTASCWAGYRALWEGNVSRSFSSEAKDDEQGEKVSQREVGKQDVGKVTEADAEGGSTDVNDSGEEVPVKLSVEELEEALRQTQAEKAELEAQLSEAKDKLVYTLADMENLRQRTARQAEDSKKFAIQGFVKSILDVADNLERASAAVDENLLAEGAEQLDAESATAMLKTMLVGVQMTEKVLLQVFQQNGIEKVSPLGQKFDPNLHQALFEMPDPSREPGTVGAVTKAGYILHGRVVRPADVGVVKA